MGGRGLCFAPRRWVEECSWFALPPGGAQLPGKISNLPTTTTLTNLQLIPAYKDQPHQQTPATTR